MSATNARLTQNNWKFWIGTVTKPRGTNAIDVVTALSPITVVVPAVTCPLWIAFHALNASGAADTMDVMNIPTTICEIPNAAAMFSVARTAAYALTAIARTPTMAKPISVRLYCTFSGC